VITSSSVSQRYRIGRLRLRTHPRPLSRSRRSRDSTSVPHCRRLHPGRYDLFRLVRACTLICIPAKEDTIVLGYHIPKGTTLIATTTTGLEDGANPIYGRSSPSIISSTDSTTAAGDDEVDEKKQGDVAVKLSDRLASLRTGKSARKVGFWAQARAKTSSLNDGSTRRGGSIRTPGRAPPSPSDNVPASARISR
jgi:hypothetical protein